MFDRNIYRGRRLTAARAYLQPALHRPNLEVRLPRTRLTRILFDGERATGVEYSQGKGGARSCTAARSSSAAARSTRRSCCSSPASGTPPSSSALGVTCVHDLPGVGENLQDHLEVYVQHASNAAGLRCSRP